jgi:tetratricopeptide (TPR) repeat protein
MMTRLRLRAAVLATALMAVTVGLSQSSSAQSLLDNPDAGPFHGQPSACFMAAVNKTAKPCPVPDVIAHNAASFGARARYFIGMQEFDKALADADAALKIAPNDIEFRHLAGRIAQTIGNDERAEQEFVAIRKIRPNDPRINTSYAIMLSGRANAQALRVLGEVIDKHPDYLLARWERARLYSYLGECCSVGNFLPAVADLAYLIQNTPPDATLLAMRANAAVVDLTAALELTPGRADLLQSRAKASAAAGFYDLAAKDLDTLLEMQGTTPIYAMFENERAKLLMDRAAALVELGRLSDAAKDAIAAVSLGGKKVVLRAQVMLRRHGFPDIPIDGQVSASLEQALSACFGLKACYQDMRAI